MAYCLWQLLVTAAGTLLLAVVTGGWTKPGAAPGPGLWAIVAYLGLFATALGIAVQSTVQPRIRPTHVALLFSTQPIFAAIGGFLFLGDELGLLQYLGGGLIVLGVIVAARR
jgi:drug/metabolite transporter (DMT)-like permease